MIPCELPVNFLRAAASKIADGAQCACEGTKRKAADPRKGHKLPPAEDTSYPVAEVPSRCVQTGLKS